MIITADTLRVVPVILQTAEAFPGGEYLVVIRSAGVVSEPTEQAKRLLINADGGGSNGSRVKLWKTSLQGFANKTNLIVTVCHFPPGTSKWNKIEHRLFSQISLNWKGQK